MRARSMIGLVGLVGLLLAGCSFTPKYIRPVGAAPSQWPMGAAYGPPQVGPAGLPWRSVVGSEKLQQVVARALDNNRDLRASLANVAAARAQYRVQKSRQLPTLAASASASQQNYASSGSVPGLASGAIPLDSYSASIGVSAFEVDLFGRLRSQSQQAFEQYLATASGLRAARLTLVAETADAYLTLASDRDLYVLAKDTVASAERTVALTQSLLDAGLGNASDVENARTVLAQARSDVENDTTQVAQDRNALELLVGAPVEDALLPASLADLDGAIAKAPAGLSSEVLRDRPDVLEAEHQLKASYAGVGAARAAFFPTFSLTASGGLASTALSTFLTSGALNAARSASASVPLLGGATKANLEAARAQQASALAAYDKAVQTAFRDVANALARDGTIGRQRSAQQDLVAAADHSLKLSEAQYRAGVQPFLATLTAQRTVYSAKQGEIRTALDDLRNRVSLYEAIGADPTL
jgi:multidrug efflux system outer membrane protein